MAEPIFPAEIVAFVARSARLTTDDLLGVRKFAHIVRARAVVAKVLRERGLSYTQIGRALRKDHTTMLYALDTFDERYAADPAAQEMLDYARYEFLDDYAEPPQPLPPPKPRSDMRVAERLRNLEKGDSALIPVDGRRDIKRAHHRVSQYGLRVGRGFRGRLTHDRTAIVFVRVR